MAQWISASDFGSGGRRFDPGRIRILALLACVHTNVMLWHNMLMICNSCMSMAVYLIDDRPDSNGEAREEPVRSMLVISHQLSCSGS